MNIWTLPEFPFSSSQIKMPSLDGVKGKSTSANIGKFLISKNKKLRISTKLY